MPLVDLIAYYDDLADEVQRKNEAYMKAMNRGGDNFG